MSQTRRQRKKQARKQAAYVKQLENIAEKAQMDALNTRQRMYAMEDRSRQATALPNGFFDHFLHKAMDQCVREMIRPMAATIRDIQYHSEQTKRAITDGMIIRTNEQMEADTFDRIDTGDKHITFRVPEFRWTQILDPHMLRDMGARREGPTFMRDEPIHFYEMSASPSLSDAPDTPIDLLTI